MSYTRRFYRIREGRNGLPEVESQEAHLITYQNGNEYWRFDQLCPLYNRHEVPTKDPILSESAVESWNRYIAAHRWQIGDYTMRRLKAEEELSAAEKALAKLLEEPAPQEG